MEKAGKGHKVLLLTFYFPPSAAAGTFRMMGLATHLEKFQWDPIVVTPPPSASEPVDDDLARALPEGVQVLRVPFPRASRWRLIRILAYHAAWLPGAAAACRRLVREHQISAVVTSSPPHCIHFLGWYLRYRYGIPWIADFRDPWVAGALSRPRGIRGLWNRFLEARVLNAADTIVANAPHAREAVAAASERWGRRVVTIPNGFDPALFPRHEKAAAAGKPIRIVHTGEIYFGRDPRPVLDALRDFSGVNFRIAFMGRFEASLDLPAEVKRRGLEAVTEITPQVSYRESLAAIMKADILLLLDTPGRQVGVPAKLYEYVGSGKPILALAEEGSDTAWVLRESGAVHRLVPPKDARAIGEGLRQLMASGNSHPPNGGKRFTRETMARSFAEALSDLRPETAPVSLKEARRLQAIEDFLPLGRRSVLEIGARDGRLTRRLPPFFGEVTALDLTKPTFSIAGVTPVEGNVTALKFADNSFDTVICTEVLEHIPPERLESACRELARVARHDVVIGVPFEQDLRDGRTRCASCRRTNPPWGHVNSFSVARLRSLFPTLHCDQIHLVGMEKSQTNVFSTLLQSLAGYPVGTYDQEESCVHCGAALAAPKPSLFGKLLVRVAWLGITLQRRMSRPRPIWVHLRFRKAPDENQAVRRARESRS